MFSMTYTFFMTLLSEPDLNLVQHPFGFSAVFFIINYFIKIRNPVKNKAARKPCSVLDNHLSGIVITHNLKRLLRSGRTTFRTFNSTLHPIGVYLANTSRYCR